MRSALRDSCKKRYGLPAVFVRYGELLTGVAATGAQYAAAVCGGHAGAEAVLVHALATGRLKCSLHNILVFYISRIWDCKGSNSYGKFKKLFEILRSALQSPLRMTL